MSVAIMGAVFKCGPTEMAAKMVLLSLADNADDFGFAFPSLGTLAGKASCDERTVQRQIEALEAGGWIKVERKAINGRGNAYFIDIGKIGVSVSSTARLSDLHSTVLRLIRDRVSSVTSSREGVRRVTAAFAAPENTDDTDTFSDDNPQATQTTSGDGSTAPCPVTDDKLCRPNHHLTTKLNHQRTINESQPNPPTPLEGGGSSQAGIALEPRITATWQSFVLALKSDLSSVPAVHAGGRFSEIVPGENDFDTCFLDWWLAMTHSEDEGSWTLVTRARDPVRTRQGVDKYRRRIEILLRDRFSLPSYVRLRIEVRDHHNLNPAA